MNGQRCCSTRGKMRDPEFPRTRITPTFVHEPIFDDLQNRPRTTSVRFTPTFYATMFDDGCQYHLKDTRYRPQDHAAQYFYSQVQKAAQDSLVRKSTASVHYKNESHFKKQEQLHQGCEYSPSKNRRDLWYDTSKENVLKKINYCNTIGISRQRKLIQLSSEPLISHQNQRYSSIITGKNLQCQNEQDLKAPKEQKVSEELKKGEQTEPIEQSKKGKSIQVQDKAKTVQKDQKACKKVQLKDRKQPATKNQKLNKAVLKRPQSCQPKTSKKESKGKPGPIFHLVTKNPIK